MFKTIILLTLSMIFISCNSSNKKDGYDSRNKKLFDVNSIALNEDKSISIEFDKDMYNPTTQYATLDENYRWDIQLDSRLFKGRESFKYENHTIKVYKNGSQIFTDTLPTNADISVVLGVDFSRADTVYTPFGINSNLTWNRTSHIVSLGLDKDEYGNYKKIYYVFLKKIKDDWSISLLKISTQSYPLYFYDKDANKVTKERDFPSYKATIFKLSTDNKASFCYTIEDNQYECLIEENDTLTFKKLFGEIYPIAFKETILKYVIFDRGISNRVKYFFDEKNNMHLFYNDLDDLTGEYFYYKMFTSEEPTIAKYAQKIEWK